MGKSAQELYDLLKDMGRTKAAVMPAIVKAVNTDDTINVDVDGLIYYDVRTKSAVKEQKGIQPKPAIDSVVMIERIGDERSAEYQVVMYSELEAYSIEIEAVKLLMDAEGFLLEKGNDTLKQILTLIIESVQKIMVLQGNNPDFIKLAQAKTKTANLLK